LPLEFSFKEFVDEIEAIRAMTEHFIAPESYHVLYNLERQLESIWSAPTTTEVPWGIRESTPLKTRISDGEYERGAGGKHKVFAEITSVWGISSIRAGIKKNRQAENFLLTGVASTHIQLKEWLGGAPRDLAMWRVEVAADDSPGCHFHVQVLGKTPDLPFPSTLSVPRLPSCIITPMAVVEFVVAELFQDQWRNYAVGDRKEIKRWRIIQRVRLERLFGWQTRVIKDVVGAPWTVMKLARPNRDLFI
jgi:hypothetical protein